MNPVRNCFVFNDVRIVMHTNEIRKFASFQTTCGNAVPLMYSRRDRNHKTNHFELPKTASVSISSILINHQYRT